MSEQTSTAVAGEHTEQVPEATEFQAIASQEDFDKAIQSRIARERAKFADYDEVKAAASRLAELEAANLTEAEKQSARTAELERENAELKSASLRATVAATKGVPAELLTGSTQAELEASADALNTFKGVQATSLHVPAEGKSPTVKPNSESEFVGALFGAGE